jgi:carbamoyltransferase
MILGLSAGFHDAGATLLAPNGNILFAGHSERYSGVKNDAHLNSELIEDALSYGIPTQVAWYEKPWLKRTRQVYSGETSKAFNFSNTPRKQVNRLLGKLPIKYYSHHQTHAAAGFQTSPFDNAIAIVVDAIGEWDTISVWKCTYDKVYLGKGIAKYKKIWSQSYPHSIGLFYSAITQYVGLKPMEDEYILMGMAAYGSPYLTAYEECLKLLENDTTCQFAQNMHTGIPENHFGKIDKYDLAAGAQKVVEQLMENLVKEFCNRDTNLVLMGGVALNCVANEKLHSLCKELWIMPNPGDCGSSLGAAALAYGKKLNWKGPYLGRNIPGEYPINDIIGELMTNKIVGVASGRAEFGPRALGTRSLLADPRGKEIKDKVNNIKKRQQFRPFAPMILEEHFKDNFQVFKQDNEPYMQCVYKCLNPDEFPAIVHKDGTSRVQTVGKDDHPDVRALLEKWYFMTGCPMLLNTSLNIKGEPMVNNRADADRFEKRYGVKVCS